MCNSHTCHERTIPHRSSSCSAGRASHTLGQMPFYAISLTTARQPHCTNNPSEHYTQLFALAYTAAKSACFSAATLPSLAAAPFTHLGQHTASAALHTAAHMQEHQHSRRHASSHTNCKSSSMVHAVDAASAMPPASPHGGQLNTGGPACRSQWHGRTQLVGTPSAACNARAAASCRHIRLPGATVPSCWQHRRCIPPAQQGTAASTLLVACKPHPYRTAGVQQWHWQHAHNSS